MSMKSYEKSPMDAKMDKMQGFKEGSKQDKAADKKELAAINKKKK